MSGFQIRRRVVGALPGWPGLDPVLARVYAGRGVDDAAELDHRLGLLHAPALLGGIDGAVTRLVVAIDANQRILVVGDFDADGATGTAVAVRGLRMLGARSVDFRVPHRQRHGYGLSAALVAEMETPPPQLIVTVDNGIASHDGIAAANARGIDVLVTDHHLPGPTLPAAVAIVNPNCSDDGFPSKALCGVGTMFYLLLATRARLRELGRFAGGSEPDLSTLLDLVALGTVADLVPLDRNNRILVQAGLKRIRAGRAQTGLRALFAVSGRDETRALATDLGFSIAPRVNAAGRLEDMRLGIACLLEDDPARARFLAERLDAINASRRELQAAMVDDAELAIADRVLERDGAGIGVCLFDPAWHAGVVGLVASKIKERMNRPVIAFAPAGEEAGLLRGSARSVAGFHLRDALAEIDARHPGMILRFGGHAMAAGLSLPQSNYERFAAEFDAVARAALGPVIDRATLWSDGSLAEVAVDIPLVRRLADGGPWGQAFPEPLFDDRFDVVSARVVGEKHLKMKLCFSGDAFQYDAIQFAATDFKPGRRIHAAYELAVDDWKGEEKVQLRVRHWLPL